MFGSLLYFVLSNFVVVDEMKVGIALYLVSWKSTQNPKNTGKLFAETGI